MTSREAYQQAAVILIDENRRKLLQVQNMIGQLTFTRTKHHGCSEQLWLMFAVKATSIASI
jgi:hypothetical protein